MLITIDRRHTIGTEYWSGHDCPLTRALRERLPGAEILVGGFTVMIDGKTYEYGPNIWNPEACKWLSLSSMHSIELEIEGFHPLFVSVAQEAAERLADKRVNN